MKKNGAELIADAVAGLDSRAVVVANVRYVIFPPTISQIAKAGHHLLAFDNGQDLSTVLKATANADALARALSVFIAKDETLYDKLKEGTLAEIVDGLEVAYSLIDPKAFMKAVSLVRNVAALIAKTR